MSTFPKRSGRALRVSVEFHPVPAAWLITEDWPTEGSRVFLLQVPQGVGTSGRPVLSRCVRCQ